MVKTYVKMVNVSKERKGGEFRVRHLGKSPSDSFNTGCEKEKSGNLESLQRQLGLNLAQLMTRLAWQGRSW